jgi:serine/threonine-protein kinase
LLEHDQLGFDPIATLTPPVGTTPIPDTVLTQTPAKGTKGHTGEKVTLVYLSPASNLPVPSVVGDTPQVAGSDIATAGLTVNSTDTNMCSNTESSGLVMDTVPVAGSLVPAGTSVKLTVSTGPCQVSVRNVVGDTQSEATSTLLAQGLQASYSPDPNAVCAAGLAQTVTGQTPSAGSLAPYGSTVDLLLCQLTPTTTQSTG